MELLLIELCLTPYVALRQNHYTSIIHLKRVNKHAVGEYAESELTNKALWAYIFN